jgi:hypothetical protein
MQLSPTQDILDAFMAECEANGAGSFAALVSATPQILNLLRNNQITLAFVPTDALVQVLMDRLKGNMALDKLSRDIVGNHFSVESSDNPSVASVTGNVMNLDQQFLATIGATKRIQIGTTQIIPITKSLLITEQQIAQLSAVRSAGFQAAFGGGQMGNTGLSVLISAGNIRGENLIRLCNSNFESRSFCEQKDASGLTIFHRLLRDEFGVTTIDPTEDIKELYLSYVNGNVGISYLQTLGDLPGAVPLGGRYGERISVNQHIRIVREFRQILAITKDGKFEAFAHRSNIDSLMPIMVELPNDAIFKKFTIVTGTKFYLLSDAGIIYILEYTMGREDLLTSRVIDQTGFKVLDLAYDRILCENSKGERTIRLVENRKYVLYVSNTTFAIDFRGSNLYSLSKDTTTGNYTLKDHSRGKEYDLSGVIKSTSRCNFKTVKFHQNMIYAVSEDGRLWYAYSEHTSLLWNDILLPVGSRVINFEFDRLMYQGVQPLPGLLTQDGQIYFFDPASIMIPTLAETIPGLIELPKIIVGLAGGVQAYTGMEVFRIRPK